jgi:hypothetical protein
MVRGQRGTAVNWEVDHDANHPIDLAARSVHQGGFCSQIPGNHDLCTDEIHLRTIVVEPISVQDICVGLKAA